MSRGNALAKTGTTQCHAQLGLLDLSAIKGLVVCNNCDLEPLDLLNGPRLLSTVPWGYNRIKASPYQKSLVFLQRCQKIKIKRQMLTYSYVFTSVTYFRIDRQCIVYINDFFSKLLEIKRLLAKCTIRRDIYMILDNFWIFSLL